MGAVTDELITLITRQVEDHGIVVWYDPEQAYAEVVEKLDLPATAVQGYRGSFFELRHRLEPWLECVEEEGSCRPDLDRPPRLVVYMPCERGRTQHALIEVEAAGVVMEPGASPWPRNTRLKVLAERVFNRVNPARAGTIGADVEQRTMTLSELDWLAAQPGDLGAVHLVFGSTAIPEVLLAFASSDQHDQAIVTKKALPDLARLIETELGFSLHADQPVAQVRDDFCRTLLLAELVLRVEAAGGNVPALASVPVPAQARQREQVLALCEQWRNRSDLKASYAGWADRVERDAQLMALGLEAHMVASVETFAGIDNLLLEWVEGQLLAGDVASARDVIAQRQTSFWALYDGVYQVRWSVLEMAAEVLAGCERVESELRGARQDAKALLRAYTDGMPAPKGGPPFPWQRLDRQYRHLEHRYARLDLGLAGDHAQLERLMLHVRRCYLEVVGQCADRWLKAFAGSGFSTDGNDGNDRTNGTDRVVRQEDVYRSYVHRSAQEGKTAYILVDALRYEMGQELLEGLGEGLDASLEPALAQLPTITEVGMAALMPRAEQGMDLVQAGAGKVAIHLGNTILKDRASRVKHFQACTSGQSLVLKLNDLMKPAKKRQEEITAAEILLVTSQEIDRRGEEGGDEEEARHYIDDVLGKLRRGIRRLASLGVRRMVLTADHGHVFHGDVFVDEPDESMTIAAPGGQTVDLHPRVWIGKGGTEAPGYVRVRASDLGLGGDLELAFPRGLACFRARGSRGGYFHGGASLQELVIPVMQITVHEARASEKGTATVTVTMAKSRITTRFFSVEVRYVVGGLFEEDTKRVKLVARAGRADVGGAAMAAYGFEEGTQEIVLKKDQPNAVTMMVTGDVQASSVSVHVLDARTQVELASLKNIPMEISL